MKLSDYLAGARGRQAELCADIGAHSPDVSRWASGLRAVPLDRCAAIEQATAGGVMCEELRPDVQWTRVPDPAWPVAQGRPCIDIARTTAKEAASAADVG